MRSPFPGMDPYLEARWSDVHSKLIVYIGEALQSKLPPALRARSEERVLLEEESSELLRQYRADVAVVKTGRQEPPLRHAAGVVVMEPIVVEFSDIPVLDRSVRIIDVTNGNRLVTAIEVLSPWNKAPGRLNRSYRRKLTDYARAGASVVEIDLLRSPRNKLKVTKNDVPPDQRTPYFACVRRGWLGERWEVYPIPLRTPIPPIAVPLREADADIVLEIQPLLHHVYTAGGHDDINYTLPPEPPLSAEDESWARTVLSR